MGCLIFPATCRGRNIWTAMIRAAEILAEGTAFVRVEGFDTDARLYFVEMTWTPNAGFKRFHPQVYERHFGDLWAKPGLGPLASLHPVP